MSVLVLDGSERLAAFPRLVVFAVDGGGWSACIVAAAGEREWLAGTFPTQDEAKRACLQGARPRLSRRWERAVDEALTDLGAEVTATRTAGAREAPRGVGRLLAFAHRRKR